MNAVDTYYKGPLEWLRDRTIFLAVGGSRAYGTNTPDSDLDLRGVGVAPAHYYSGFMNTWNEVTQHEPTDLVIFEVTKYFKLASEANPNVIEMIWQDPADYLLMTPAGEKMLAARDLFVSKKARYTFAGYARGQLKRLRLHHAWHTNPITHEPTRKEFGLPEHTTLPKDQLDAVRAVIKKRVQSWELDLAEVDPGLRINLLSRFEEVLSEVAACSSEVLEETLEMAAARELGLDSNFLEMLGHERSYRGARTQWQQYQEWLKNRNPKRAELENKFGYDAKFAMHLVRLYRCGAEILETGKVLVKRPDAAELLAIRNGAWTYEYLMEWAEKQDTILDRLYETSKLPHSADRVALDKLCVSIVDSYR